MAEYGGKQRNQLSKVISRSESKDVQLQRFADNRPRTDSQLNLIHSIQKKPNNTGLPDSLKFGVENLSGYSMDDVKVHYNSDKPAQISALAYAQGTDIHLAPGQEKHLPHEVWHVVQQKQGRVQPTAQMQGVNVNDNEGLEKEADIMGQILQYTKSKAHQCNQFFRKSFKQEIIQKLGVEENPDAKDDAKKLFKWRSDNHDHLNGAHNYAFLNETDTYAKSDSSSHAEIKLLALLGGKNAYIVSELKPCEKCREFLRKYERHFRVEAIVYYNIDYEEANATENAEKIKEMYRTYGWISKDERIVTYLLAAGKRILDGK